MTIQRAKSILGGKPRRINHDPATATPLLSREVPLQTVRGLLVVLQGLVDQGHGDTAIARADIEAGWCGVHALELYDTAAEKESGELAESMTFLIC